MKKDNLKYIKNFEEKSIPNVIKKISNIIRKDLLENNNNSFNELPRH